MKPLFTLPDEVAPPAQPQSSYALQLADDQGSLWYFKTHRSGWYGHQSDFVSADERPNRYQTLRAARNARARIAKQLKAHYRDRLKVVDYPYQEKSHDR